jgi:hypothetical protein
MPNPALPRHNPWSDYFLRAAKEEIGIAVEVNELRDGLDKVIWEGRPPGFEEYTVVIPSIHNTIFIVKPGVTLD